MSYKKLIVKEYLSITAVQKRHLILPRKMVVVIQFIMKVQHTKIFIQKLRLIPDLLTVALQVAIQA
jgi:hypothetical protein